MDQGTLLYDEDFHAWTQEQAAVLRQAAALRVNVPVDFTNLAEEVEDLGASQRRAVQSDLMRVMEHLLKLEHGSAAEPRSDWRYPVIEHRIHIADILAESPSLRPRLPELCQRAWQSGRRLAAEGLARFPGGAPALPPDCPYSIEQVLAEEWWPVPRHGGEPK